MTRRSFSATVIATLGLCLAATSCRGAGPPPPVTIENVRAGFGEELTGLRYKTGTWTPVWVDLKAGAGRFEGMLEVVTGDDDGTPTTIRTPVNLAPDALGTFVIYVRPGSRNGELAVHVLGRNGRAVDRWNGAAISSVGPETSVVVTSGSPAGVAEMGEMPKYKGTNLAYNADPLLVLPVRPRDGFPGRWYGLDGADAIVLQTNDAATLARIRSASQSIREWVAMGGHLVVAVGSNWQAVKDSPLEPLLPGVPAGRVRLTDPRELESFAGSSTHPIKDALQVTKFEGWEARGAVPLASTATTPLVLRGAFGFGRVTMVGLDADQAPFATWADRGQFWDKALDLRGRSDDSQNFNPAPGTAFYRTGNNDLASTLHESLERFPGVRLVPFGWVAFFVFVYILLIGPGDYLFLRKVVKRMELTWLTFPAIVLAVSALAYAAAYYFKGTELRVNKVDVLDVDQATGLARGTTWFTLFSPQNRDYSVSIAPLPSAVEPSAAGSTPAKPNANVETILSWFGSPEQGFGGGGVAFGGAGYLYGPLDVPEAIGGVRVPIWSTKSFLGRWDGPADAPLLESDLAPNGPDRIAGSVTNSSHRPMHKAAILFGRFAYPLGDGNLAPGQTATVNTLEARPLGTYLERLGTSGQQGRTANGAVVPNPNASTTNVGDDEAAQLARPSLVRSILFHDFAGAAVSGSTNMALKTLDMTGLLDLKRPMLLAEVDGPAAQLVLDGAGSTPKIHQTTLLRVILPLKAEAAPAP